MFFPGQLVWHSRTKRGDQYKFVSRAAVLQALQAGAVDSGWLAPGVVRAGQTARGGFALMIAPSGRLTIPVERSKGSGVEDLALHLPALAFLGHGKRYYVWALKSTAKPAGAQVYRAPLPNVFDDGGICWGTNTPPPASGTTLPEAWRLFLSAPFNGHAASGKVRGERGDVRSLLRELARTRAKFPPDVLLPFRDYDNTLDAVVNAIIGGAE
jgi:PRTRC genetic system protein B